MASFGVQATDLIFEIVGGLKQDEEQRLGKPKTKSAPVQVVETNRRGSNRRIRLP